MFPILTNLSGESEPLYDVKSIKRISEVNGERTLSFVVLKTDRNNHAFPLLEEESTVEYDDITYTIKSSKENNKGLKSAKQINAKHKLFTDLIDHYHYTALSSGYKQLDVVLDFIFNGTVYTYSINGVFASESFESFGNDNALSLLQDVLKRYSVEFDISGTHLTFDAQIGVVTDMQLRYGHNIKAISKSVDTDNLSTYIKGYGKGGLEVEYTSPNESIYGIRHAKPYTNESFTIADNLIERIKKEIQDEPEISFEVDFVDLRNAGYPYEVPNLGDTVYVIYEPMEIDITARIMRIEETIDAKGRVVDTKVTLANFNNNLEDMIADIGKTQKEINDRFNDDGKLKYSVVPDAVSRATEDLQSAQTELEFNNGIIARSTINPNHLVLFNSSGIGVSVDGGVTFQTAMTAEGFVADLITVGTMLADRIKGGQFTLGGYENVNGEMFILNSNGEVIANFDANRGGFSNLYVENLESPTVVAKSTSEINLYVSNNGDDTNDGSSGARLRTISEAIRRLPKHLEHNVVIESSSGHTYNEDITISGFTGTGSITFDGLSNVNTKITGRIRAINNVSYVLFQNFTQYSNHSYSCLDYDNTNGRVANVTVYGKSGGTQFGIDALHGSYLEVQDCQTYDTDYGISSRYGATIMLVAKEYLNGSRGYGNTAGLFTYGGYITGYGTAPDGATFKSNSSGGQNWANVTANSGSYSAPPPPETTTTWNQTSSESWRENYGGQWSGGSTGSDVLQGKWDTWGRYKGCWFFGSNPSTAVTGKTIKQIRVYLTRANNSGYSSSVNAVIRPHGYTSKPAGEPSYLGTSHSVGFKWGEGKWVTLPTSFHSYFESGSAKGIMIYTSSTSNSDYMRFNGSAKIEITYS